MASPCRPYARAGYLGFARCTSAVKCVSYLLQAECRIVRVTLRGTAEICIVVCLVQWCVSLYPLNEVRVGQHHLAVCFKLGHTVDDVVTDLLARAARAIQYQYALAQPTDGMRTATVAVSGRFNVNSVGMIRRMASLNMGVILMPPEVVADEVNGGQLVPILPDWRGSPTTVYAITETRLLPAKTQRFIEFLRERL